MHLILTEESRCSLLKQHKTERDKRTADRIKTVLLSDEGGSPLKISHALFISEDSIRRHLQAYEEESRLTALHKGSKPLLNAAESQALSSHLESTLYVKIRDIQGYVRERFGKTLGITTLYQWLKAHGFSYKKPKLVPKNADPVLQEMFIKEYEALMTEASLEGDLVLFGDSVHPSQQTRAAYGWIKTGASHLIETTGARKRVNIMGALNLETMDFTYQDFETINGVSAVEFLKRLEKEYPKVKTVHLIWDRAGYHTGQNVKEYLNKTNCRIKVHYLPPRSPNLNPIERLWKIMHEHVSNNRTYERQFGIRNAINPRKINEFNGGK